jgi:uncharacterized RDD family membrane protein YckC
LSAAAEIPAKPLRGAAAAERAATRELVTPEGVDLGVRLGAASQRAGAFVLDFLIIMLSMIAMTIVIALAFSAMGKVAQEALGALWLLGFFVLRNFYFAAFELRQGAATPGKRVFGLRVAARNGGRLDAAAIFARNAMREIEIFLPLSFLAANGGGVDGWLTVLGLIWSGVFALFPLFNKDRLRVGDFVAGTWVVRSPKRSLLEDVAGRSNLAPDRPVFSNQQLDVYGVKELQVLEDILRRRNLKTYAAVAERVRRKIDWTPAPDETDWAFLEAYYIALRGRLEARLLLGKRKQDKFDTGDG